MGIENYSVIADDNDDAVPNGWAEGMAASGVNNSARQNMADTRKQWNDAEWFEFGDGTPDGVVTFVANNQFKIVSPTNADVTGHWHIGRKVQIVDVSPLTTFATITATSFSVDTTTVTIDSTPLTNVALTAFASTIPLVNSNLPDNPTFSEITATTGINLGGTASDNLLGDYQTEISFTVEVSDAEVGGNLASGSFLGRESWIGDRVSLDINLTDIDTSGMTGGNFLFIRGFTHSNDSSLSVVGPSNTDLVTFGSFVTCTIGPSKIVTRLRDASDGAVDDFIKVNAITSGTSDIQLSVSYPK